MISGGAKNSESPHVRSVSRAVRVAVSGEDPDLRPARPERREELSRSRLSAGAPGDLDLDLVEALEQARSALFGKLGELLEDGAPLGESQIRSDRVEIVRGHGERSVEIEDPVFLGCETHAVVNGREQKPFDDRSRPQLLTVRDSQPISYSSENLSAIQRLTSFSSAGSAGASFSLPMFLRISA